MKTVNGSTAAQHANAAKLPVPSWIIPDDNSQQAEDKTVRWAEADSRQLKFMSIWHLKAYNNKYHEIEPLFVFV